MLVLDFLADEGFVIFPKINFFIVGAVVGFNSGDAELGTGATKGLASTGESFFAELLVLLAGRVCVSIIFFRGSE